jgi:hypothetical protein
LERRLRPAAGRIAQTCRTNPAFRSPDALATSHRDVLRALELAGCIVTADALHCQKDIAKEIIEADADYGWRSKAIKAQPSRR